MMMPPTLMVSGFSACVLSVWAKPVMVMPDAMAANNNFFMLQRFEK
jgi:hypothetical protein